eukprot:CAMPEP_0182908626 /NCGR_PEP_ID=MMETSP0034_2-20130328/35312_1 /TAXON_ID=156128 /ORGANISM="Nephroselmis pyriformis, Strain CCMP717" /LENGTH=168 /DNA_ID=CAMNT_0025044817 /DNA_START=24 /DNA_END=527 /DNA_ORIENTATION=-
MIYEKVLKRAGKLVPNAKFQRAFNEGGVQALLNKNKATLKQVFTWVSAGQSGVDFVRWVGFCKRVGALGHRLSVTKAMQLFVEVVDTLSAGTWGIEDDNFLLQPEGGGDLSAIHAMVSKAPDGGATLNYDGFLRCLSYAALEYAGLQGAGKEEVVMAVDSFLDRRMFP